MLNHRYKSLYTVWFHFYTDQKQAKLNYGVKRQGRGYLYDKGGIVIARRHGDRVVVLSEVLVMFYLSPQLFFEFFRPAKS